MADCQNCGANLPEDARFCVDCGAKIETEDVVETSSVSTVSGLRTVIPGDIPTPDPGKLGPGEILEAGSVIAGQYEIESVLGQGGMGVVYKAKERDTGEAVALKLINAKYVRNEKAVDRLIAEGLITRKIAHESVVRIYGIGRDGDRPYIAMEYVEGVPLHIWRGQKMANNESVPVRVAGQIIKEVLNGLQAAHAKGVIHRDLKPENIMLIGEPSEKSAKIRIVDFGIALATKADTQSGTGTGLGTQLYMAPEQIRNANAANAAADLYSVSKIFYELIVGVLPTGHWQPPSDGRSDVPLGIDALIAQGLKANRDARPQSAAEYRELMIKAFNEGGSPRPAPKPVRPSPTPGPDREPGFVNFFKDRSVKFWIWFGIAVFIALMLMSPDFWMAFEQSYYENKY